jgi:hypothetical protein
MIFKVGTELIKRKSEKESEKKRERDDLVQSMK